MKIPGKITSGMNIFKDGVNIINGIIDYLNSPYITGGQGIQTNSSAGSIIISASKKGGGGGGGASADYNGYFNFIATGLSIDVVDGYTDDIDTETTAGQCTVNNQLFGVPRTTLTLTSGLYFIYLVATYSDGEIDYPTIEVFTSLKEDIADTAYFLLYRITVVDSAITKTSREFHGMPKLILWGDCDA